MDEVLQHFSHEHPLMLIDEAPKSEEKVVCYGCQKPILGSAYSCSENCNYFLHNKCAQLPKEIKHPMHSQHPLTLFAKPPYKSSRCDCDICKIDWEWFTYHCSHCHFDIHIQCILEEEVVVDHECHDHPLILVQRSALFMCDACGVKDEDLSYKCTICPFWIHKTCASLPNTIKHSDHNHPLVLAYSLPDNFHSFSYNCYICHHKMHPSDWVYHCANCRYFVHLKCATTAKKEPSMLRDEIEAEDPNMMHFPKPDGSVTKIVQEVNSEDDEIGTELLHFSHHHPLHLSKATKDDEIICNGCVRPISTPFYHCEQYDFCLHKSCAQLPLELQHPSHPDHPLSLQMTPSLNGSCFLCHSCNIYCNGLRYSCDSCKFYLDVNCATTSLPTTIKHEAHNHPLHLQTQPPPLCLCNGCGRTIYSDTFGYGCEACVFYLHNYCARLPTTISHSWDRHPIKLRYPPFDYHPDEIFCEICEEEMHPNHWIYHCRRCDQPFHYQCVRPFQKYSNFKFGVSIKISNHPHNLTFVQQSKNKSLSPCYKCGVRPYDIPLLECAPCNFIICIRCCLP